MPTPLAGGLLKPFPAPNVSFLAQVWPEPFAGDPGDTTALHPHRELEASPQFYVMFSVNTVGCSPKPLAFGAGGGELEGSQPWKEIVQVWCRDPRCCMECVSKGVLCKKT